MWPTCLQLVKRQIHRLIIFLSRAVRHNTHGLFPKTFCLMFNRLKELQKQPPLPPPCNPARQERTCRCSRLEETLFAIWAGGDQPLLHTSPFHEKFPSLQKGYGLTLAKHFNLVCTLKKKVYLRLSTWNVISRFITMGFHVQDAKVSFKFAFS